MNPDKVRDVSTRDPLGASLRPRIDSLPNEHTLELDDRQRDAAAGPPA